MLLHKPAFSLKIHECYVINCRFLLVKLNATLKIIKVAFKWKISNVHLCIGLFIIKAYLPYDASTLNPSNDIIFGNVLILQ